MKAEGKEGHGGMKSEQKAEQKSEKDNDLAKARRNVITVRRSVMRDQTTTEGRDRRP